jgi:hypothetical protein
MGEFDALCGGRAFGFGHVGRGRSAVTGAGMRVAPPTGSTHHLLWTRLQWLRVGRFCGRRELLARRRACVAANLFGLKFGGRFWQSLGLLLAVVFGFARFRKRLTVDRQTLR